MSSANLELWQTEWCPASHRVRQRLTELPATAAEVRRRLAAVVERAGRP